MFDDEGELHPEVELGVAICFAALEGEDDALPEDVEEGEVGILTQLPVRASDPDEWARTGRFSVGDGRDTSLTRVKLDPDHHGTAYFTPLEWHSPEDLDSEYLFELEDAWFSLPYGADRLDLAGIVQDGGYRLLYFPYSGTREAYRGGDFGADTANMQYLHGYSMPSSGHVVPTPEGYVPRPPKVDFGGVLRINARKSDFVLQETKSNQDVASPCLDGMRAMFGRKAIRLLQRMGTSEWNLTLQPKDDADRKLFGQIISGRGIEESPIQVAIAAKGCTLLLLVEKLTLELLGKDEPDRTVVVPDVDESIIVSFTDGQMQFDHNTNTGQIRRVFFGEHARVTSEFNNPEAATRAAETLRRLFDHMALRAGYTGEDGTRGTATIEDGDFPMTFVSSF